MPKIIENLKEEYIKSAKEILMYEGYKKLTLRKVASKCGVALSTLYNYFDSKDDLLANIMIEDWFKLIDEVTIKCKKSKDTIDGLHEIYQSIREFSNLYRFVWKENSLLTIPADKHKILVRQTSDLVLIVIEKQDRKLANFIAEILLNYGIREIDEFDSIKDYLIKLSN